MTSKICIVESTNRRLGINDTSIVHVKNSLILARELNADIVMCEDDAPMLENKYDHIIFAYGSPYMPYNSYVDRVLENKDASLLWMVNDHDIEDNIALRKIIIAENGRRKYRVICNNPQAGYRHWIMNKNIHGKKLHEWIGDWLTVNLNTLIFNEHSNTVADSLFQQQENKAIYWGTYRKHRLPYFKKYADTSIVFSTSNKNQKKLIANDCGFTFCEKIDWRYVMPYAASLYLEDVHTHDNYAFLANRFYEALNNGMATFFDVSTANTVSKCGLDLGACMVDGVNDLNAKIKNWESIYSKQIANAAAIHNEKQEVIKKINIFIKNS